MFGGVGSPLGAANQGYDQYPWSSGTPCTEREMSGKTPLGSQRPESGDGRRGLRHGLPPTKPLHKFPEWISLTLRSIASDFCKSKFRAVGKQKEGVRQERRLVLLLASGSYMEDAGGWGKTSLPYPLPSSGPEYVKQDCEDGP